MRVLFIGCGDLGTGAAHHCFVAGHRVAVIERPQPLAVRRMVSFAEAARTGAVSVEGVSCKKVPVADWLHSPFSPDFVSLVIGRFQDVLADWHKQQPPVFPEVLVDARLRKRAPEPELQEWRRHCRLVFLGPGAEAGVDCDVVVETKRGDQLGRLIWQGSAATDTGIPGNIAGFDRERVIRSPANGRLEVEVELGARVVVGQELGRVDGVVIEAPLSGMLRGFLAHGDRVEKNQKLGDIDPRGSAPPVHAISDKAHAIGRSVVEALRAY